GRLLSIYHAITPEFWPKLMHEFFSLDYALCPELEKCASECTSAVLVAPPIAAIYNRARAEQNRSKPMTRNGWIVFLGAAFVAVAETTLGQRPASWRVYKVIDGLPESACSSVSISPQGKVVGKHLNLLSASNGGGYTVTFV